MPPPISTFERILPERSVERFNWSVLDDPTLHQPTGRGRAADASHVTGENAGDQLRLRVERQTIRRLPTTRDVHFTIRVYVRPLAELAATPSDALRLAAALEGMGRSMRAYKGLSVLADGAIQWLRRAGS
ncbi:MAG: heme-dependent oxidative N-demethylase subunit alpha family protein [Gaiellaceae bacterium]